MKKTKISSKYQLTIPKALVDTYRIEKGDHVVLEPRKEGVLVRAVSGRVSDAYYGYAKKTWQKLGGTRHVKRERASWRGRKTS